MSAELLSRLRATWAEVAQAYPNHELLLPGGPSFVCLTAECPVHCCFRFNVSLGVAEVRRLSESSGLRPTDFLESDEQGPIELPLAQPYVLARDDGHCRLLGGDRLCSQYEGRPDGCRSYPHQALFIDCVAARPVHGDREALREGLAGLLSGRLARVHPLLLRHSSCPGFTGPALSPSGWLQLLTATAELQYPGVASPGRGATAGR